MGPSAREVGLWRLVAQRVVPPLGGAAAVVAHLLCVQAQDPRAAATAVALRTAPGAPDLPAALDRGEVVRSWPLRGTLHLLPAADLPWVLALCAPRVLRSTTARRTALGIDGDDVAAARRAAEDLLGGGRGAVRSEVLAAFEAAGQGTAAGRGYHLLLHLSLTGVLCLGPVRGREQQFVLLAEHVPAPRALEGEEALAELALRFLLSHGPASVADLARWAGLPVTAARRAVAAVRGRLAAVDVSGTELLHDPALPDLVAGHRRAAAGTHLLPGFDEFLLGYADRSHVLPAEHAERVVPGGNGVFRGTVVHGGAVVGTWTREGDGVGTEPFGAFAPAVLRGVQRCAAALPGGRLG
ncbi:winged helix DNA-binding domain-containing protein [Kineococcus indalonis]|uniref:winged helix DNA-binding domain-containing protein n=1 Tax=Kineococcus indalonis TaxID=2696566 RepID=UPI001412051E|nr:winged helix DNA-binding domain-containing protein [Kineococcus indalonis]NAZ87619.1 winged helix DNA-binding domain-containing protein [Kineococcus indalonis]